MKSTKDQSIYSGLSNEQAFSVMMADIELKEELPQLSKWNARRYWKNALVFVAGSMALVIAVAVAFNTSLIALVASAVGTAMCVLGVAWIEARWTQKRLSYLVNLETGLDQLRAAAERSPGASAADLIASISNVPVAVSK